MSYLIDSDTCSAVLKNDRRVFGRFMQHLGQLHISSVTAGELFAWTFRANAPASRLRRMADLLNDVTVLDFGEPEARAFGSLRAALLNAGRPAPALDLLISATAVHHGLTLITHNIRDYANVPGLTVEDWLAP